MVRLFLVFLVLSGPAFAGAWPRGAGKGFATASTRLLASDPAGPVYRYSTLYLEYGLNDRLTLGLDAGRGVSGDSKVIAFLRFPIIAPRRGTYWAAELGLGQIAGETTLRPGISYGRGFSAGQRSGWIAIDTLAEFRVASKRTDLKADVTIGLNYSDRVKGILQLQTGVSSGDPSFLRLAPSVIIRTSQNSNIEFGLNAGLLGDKTLGVTFGFWRDF